MTKTKKVIASSDNSDVLNTPVSGSHNSINEEADSTITINKDEVADTFEINRRLIKLQKDIDKAQSDAENLKKDFIGIFGIFASLITFVSVEVTIFKNADSFALLVGTSLFFLSALILFAVTIQNIANDRYSYKDFIKPPFVMALFFFSASMVIFAYHVLHK